MQMSVTYCTKQHHRHVQKVKEYKCKHNCNRSLKNKLKKYKLRHDGAEDEDVLDVSKILVSSLLIRSPSKIKDPIAETVDSNHFEEPRPRNYLFKMVKTKTSVKISDPVNTPIIEIKHKKATEMPEVTEKKHTNAFKLLMDSRNKSIGGNSPGKEKSDNQSDAEEILEKKTTRVKRKLLLQKMAEAKGYLKNKESDEYQDEIIKKKMDKRAERLKNMVLKDSKSVRPNHDSGSNEIKTVDSIRLNKKVDVEVINNNSAANKAKKFQIVDIFNTFNDSITTEKKHIPQEDKEFLEKLSPSLKKKESMLSYFKKVDKESECSPVGSDNENLIKVKLQVKGKKRGRKKMLSLKKDCNNVIDTPDVDDKINIIQDGSNKMLSVAVSACPEFSDAHNNDERPKGKRNPKRDIRQVTESHGTPLNDESRPKRSIKRPIKYTDDAYITSSDEELHIFTPKKKKHIDSKNLAKHPESIQIVEVDLITEKSIKKKIVNEKEKEMNKKPVKLAPIFASKQLDSTALEAKQKFLQSGVPDKLKKIINQQKENSKLSSDFPVVVHVQQKDETCIISQYELYTFEEYIDDDVCLPAYEQNAIKKLLNLSNTSLINKIEDMKQSCQTILHGIKQLHPEFPVYRTYHYLKSKKKGEVKVCNVNVNNSIEVMSDMIDVINDSPERLNWTDRYKATSTNQIIGNFGAIKELKKWLISWTENEIKSKTKPSGSDSSDYYQSDTDSRESLKSLNNLLILTGPTGCGKTSSVYAVAAELAMKVIEVNASSKRTGKIMLQDLQEATQSHKVNRGTSTDNSQKSQEREEKNLTELLKKSKKRGRPKKSAVVVKPLPKVEVLSCTPSSQESTRTDMSLILIDDADIVFDQDDGFSSAILQLVQCSKRPVILITSTLICAHLQRFFQTGKILQMAPLLPRLLGTWLDIMCLADSGISWPGSGAKLLNYFKGDIRKTINYLHFIVSSSNSDSEAASQNEDYKVNIDDESSGMSWADSEDTERKKLMADPHNKIKQNVFWDEYISKHFNLTNYRHPMQIFDVWWSVPRLLGVVPNSYKDNNTKVKNYEIKDLEAMADSLDAISLSDYITNQHLDAATNITARPWYFSEIDSMSEQDNIDHYMNRYIVGDEICRTMVTSSITIAQDTISCDRNTEITFPGMSLQRVKDRVTSRHTNLTSYLSPWSTLDRRSLALDYWSTCRTICRIEKQKNDTNMNTKRNNRFCHYLKSLNVLCKGETLDKLCESLSNVSTELNITDLIES